MAVVLVMLIIVPERRKVSAQAKAAVATQEPGQPTDEDDAVDFPTINDSIPSCLDFANATSQLWNIWTIENNGDKSVENVQRDEIAIKDWRELRCRNANEIRQTARMAANNVLLLTCQEKPPVKLSE